MNCETTDCFFLMLFSNIIQFGRIISDVVRDMSVTQFLTVGHIATLSALTLGMYSYD